LRQQVSTMTSAISTHKKQDRKRKRSRDRSHEKPWNSALVKYVLRPWWLE